MNVLKKSSGSLPPPLQPPITPSGSSYVPPKIPVAQAPAPTFTPTVFKPRTPKQQSAGTVASIIIIMLMVVIGAFYAWGKKIQEERAAAEQVTGVAQ